MDNKKKEQLKNRVLKSLEEIAFADFSHYAYIETGEDGVQYIVKATGDISSAKRRAICTLKQGTKGIELKLYDKIKALELLGRITGLFKDNDSDEELLGELQKMLGDVASDDTEEENDD